MQMRAKYYKGSRVIRLVHMRTHSLFRNWERESIGLITPRATCLVRSSSKETFWMESSRRDRRGEAALAVDAGADVQVGDERQG